MRSVILCLCGVVALLLTGCGVNKRSLYPGTAQPADLRAPTIQILGDVTACQGAWCKKPEGGYEWPIGLSHPPAALTYQRALERKAAQQFGVPESEVVLGDISVGFTTELIGTIRGWEASAVAGRKTTPGEAAKATPEAPTWLPR